MNGQDFNTLLEERMNKIRATLASKASEYASDKDRLHNFKRAAALRRKSPAEALVGMVTKQIVSVLDMVDAIEDGYQRNMLKRPCEQFPPEYIDEKIGDVINYMILLEAILKE